MTKKTRAKRGAARRDFASRLDKFRDRPDRRCWIAPEREAVPITLPEITWGDVTDADVGLPDDPVAQFRAETYLKAVIAYRQREDDRARQLARAAALAVPANVPVLHVEVPDEALVLVDPTDRLSPEDATILAELRRIAGRQRRDDRGASVA